MPAELARALHTRCQPRACPTNPYGAALGSKFLAIQRIGGVLPASSALARRAPARINPSTAAPSATCPAISTADVGAPRFVWPLISAFRPNRKYVAVVPVAIAR